MGRLKFLIPAVLPSAGTRPFWRDPRVSVKGEQSKRLISCGLGLTLKIDSRSVGLVRVRHCLSTATRRRGESSPRHSQRRQSTIPWEMIYAISCQSKHACRGRERGGEGRKTRRNHPVHTCGSEARGRLFHGRQWSTDGVSFP